MLTPAAINIMAGPVSAIDLIYCDTCGATLRDVQNHCELYGIRTRDAVCCELSEPPKDWLEDWV